MAKYMDETAMGATNFPGIQPLYAGTQACRPGHRWGPMARDHHLFHLVLSGQGTFRNPAGEWVLGPGRGFLIRPGQRVQYRADGKNPWTYLWLGLREGAAGSVWDTLSIGADGLYGTARPRAVARAHERLRLAFANRAAPLSLLARTYDLLAALEEHRDPGLSPSPRAGVLARVERSVELLHRHTGETIPVAQLAAAVGLSPGHFSALFKAHTGRTPRRFQIDWRLERAVDLLRHSDLPVGAIGARCGFEDPLYFTRIFHRRFGQAPGKWRAENRR